MSQIHVLDDATINKIAAGEVVERPASVIKELIENAMDAGATRIEVEIMAGGTSFMRVTDNGKGMSMEDAKLAILRHATSKIQTAGDLTTVGTLGFRGEALPTIASVSRFTMLTRRNGDDLGTRVDICGGKAPEIQETGCHIGTTIKVEDLFFNTPARKKFLRTNHTEASKSMILSSNWPYPVRISRFISSIIIRFQSLHRAAATCMMRYGRYTVRQWPIRCWLYSWKGKIYGFPAILRSRLC